MKKITQEQIQAILAEFFKVNVPVQSYEALQKLLLELPDVKSDKEKITK